MDAAQKILEETIVDTNTQEQNKKQEEITRITNKS